MASTRRNIFQYAAAGVAVLAFPTRPGAPTDDLARLFADPRAAAAIGRAYLQAHAEPLPSLRAQVTAALRSGDPAMAPLARFHQRVQQDFADGNIVTVDGWMLSRTEAQACAIACLSAGGRSEMDALIGYTGFVGGNLIRQHDFGCLYNSANIAAIAGMHFDTLVFAGAQGKKWWANQNPAKDWAGIQSALDAMQGVTADRVILISTIDVVPPVPGADESFDCTSQPTHAYGENRLRLEAALRDRFPKTVIVRLPALTGPDLRKNIIYDLVHDNLVDKIDPASRFQFYDLNRLWPDIDMISRAGIDLVHLVTEPVRTGDIVAQFFPGTTIGQPPATGSATYDFRTRHAGLFGGSGGYIYDSAEVMRRIGAYVAAAKAEAAKPA